MCHCDKLHAGRAFATAAGFATFLGTVAAATRCGMLNAVNGGKPHASDYECRRCGCRFAARWDERTSRGMWTRIAPWGF